MAIWDLAIFEIVILMIVFSIIEFRCLCDSGGGFVTLVIQYLKIFFSKKFLIVIQIEYF